MTNTRLFAVLTSLILISGALFASELEDIAGTADATFLKQNYQLKEAADIPMPALPERVNSGAVAASGRELKAAAFDVLANMFANGTLPRLQFMAGWYAGRAFSDVTPNTPEGTLFTGVYMESLPGGGPLFEKELRFAFFGNWETVDKYEKLTYSEINLVKTLIADECMKLSLPQSNGKELTLGRTMPDGFNELYQLRQSGYYLILKHTWSRQEGTVTVKGTRYAYYFRNVTPYYY